jgi:hypothetical protein
VNTTNTDPFTEVPVHAGILHATADLLDVLGDFLTHAAATTRAQLGSYLIDHHDTDTTTDPATAAAIMLADLDEAADLLHTLANGTNP